MECVACLAAKGVIRDAGNNSISIFEILEVIIPAGFPFVIHEMAVLGIWRRTGDAATIAAELEVRLNGEVRDTIPITIPLDNAALSRAIITLRGVVVTEPGDLELVFVADGKGVGSYVIRVEPPSPGMAMEIPDTVQREISESSLGSTPSPSGACADLGSRGAHRTREAKPRPRLQTRSGRPVEPHEAIFPVFTKVASEVRAIGTGFFVSPSGFFLTAAHVATDQELETLIIPQFLDEAKRIYMPRTVAAAIAHRQTDIAFGVLEPLWQRGSAEPLWTPAVAITSAHPEVGESVSCYSYPGTLVGRATESHFALFSGGWDTGVILERYLKGRDSFLQPGICFETSLRIEGGGSGGPVFNSAGQVFGVVSSGITEAGVTYVASLVELLDFPFAHDASEGGSEGESVTLRSFAVVDVPLSSD